MSDLSSALRLSSGSADLACNVRHWLLEVDSDFCFHANSALSSVPVACSVALSHPHLFVRWISQCSSLVGRKSPSVSVCAPPEHSYHHITASIEHNCQTHSCYLTKTLPTRCCGTAGRVPCLWLLQGTSFCARLGHLF